jgi:hypothetical protein
MKLTSIFLALAASSVAAQTEPVATISIAPANISDAPTTTSSVAPETPVSGIPEAVPEATVTGVPDATGTGVPDAVGVPEAVAAPSVDAFAGLKTYPNTDTYHMKPIRVVQARVQGDTPVWNETLSRFVSKYGGWVATLDTVNTASVEGALMYVQAEGINVNGRSESERCIRKAKMQNIVFYELLIAQTNETIAQFQDNWETREYGPMIAMDGGACSATEGGKLPNACLQFNGVNGQPNLGPFIGGTSKETDLRAPYPNNYWFSFPHTCPTKGWSSGEKTEECRAKTRKGLCDFGYAPDGITCTFTYNILGWVPIDDVVGITSVKNPVTGKLYSNFTEWCEADEKNFELKADPATGEPEKDGVGLAFWNDPQNSTANAERAKKVLEAYDNVIKSGSIQVKKEDSDKFQLLPTPKFLAEKNPECYKSVKECDGGCKRAYYSQLCISCEEGEEGCLKNEGAFIFPTLEKAKTSLSDEETNSTGDSSVNGSGSTGDSSSNGSGSKNSGAISATPVALLTIVAGAIIAVFSF